MTSGQCTIGAIRKVRRVAAGGKHLALLDQLRGEWSRRRSCFIIASVLALHTTVASGYRRRISASVAE